MSNRENKIKIAIISESLNIGGAEMMAARLATYIDKKKYLIKFFVIGKKQDNQIYNIIKEADIEYECLGLSTSFDFKSYFIFDKALRRFNPDIVHEHLDACYSWIWTIIYNKPLIATIHSDPFRRQNRKVEMVIRIKTFQKNLKIVGCSEKTSTLVKSCYRLTDSYVTTIYNPIDIKKYRKSKHNNECISFVHVGRFNAVKNHEMLINSFSLIKSNNVKLYLAGEGKLFEPMKQKVREMKLQDKIIFLGNVDDIPGLLEKMDVLVLSSKTEACPMVILEAMAAGLPIVATRVGGVPELVTDNGILVDSEDEKAFAEAIQELVNDRKKILNYSQKSINNVKEFDQEKISLMYEKVYDSVEKRKCKV